MEELRAWVLCLAAAAAAATFAMAISPRGAMDKTIRSVAGIFVVAAICSPLASLIKSEYSLPAFSRIDEYEDCGSENELREYLAEACRSAAEAEVKSQAERFGTEAELITIDMNIDEEYCIIIHKISVKTKGGSPENLAGFASELSERLGVEVTLDSE